jgi:hypothetical protein
MNREQVRKVKTVITAIKKVLGGPDNESARALWMLLAALRGPDQQESDNFGEIKSSTTAVIRWRMFGRKNYFAVDHHEDCADFVEFRKKFFYDHTTHFSIHAEKAFHILDELGIK